MVVTAELLSNFTGIEKIVPYFEKMYPNGASLIDIINTKNINKQFLHWLKEHFSFSERELRAYAEACCIHNCDGYWYSENAINSTYVIHSKNVQDSRGVFHSTDITKSTDVVNCESVDNCTQVFFSNMVDECKKILRSANATRSFVICDATGIIGSKNIINSSSVFNSSEIINSTNVSNSHFCQNCKNIKHCLFCLDLENAEYHIFNQPIEKEWYEQFERQYEKYQTADLEFVEEWPEDLLSSAVGITNKSFDNWFVKVSERFWKWARTLPGFDSMLIYEITMLPDILIDRT